MKILEREIGFLTYAQGQTRTLELPRNYAYRHLFLTLIAQLDRASTTPDAGGPKDSAPAQLVQNITVRANGRDVIKSIDLETLHRLSEQRHHVRPKISSEDWAGYADATNKILIVTAQLDFAMWDAIRPIDTLLDSAGLATLDFIVTFGAGIDTMNDTWPGGGSAETVTVDSAILYVSSCEEVGVPIGTRFMTNKEFMIRKEVTAASTNFQIDLPVGNLYRSIVIKTHSDGDQVNTILPFGLANQNAIQLQSGTEVYKHRIAGLLQAENRLAKEMQIPELTASAAALNHRLLEHPQEGYYVLEFCPDGRLTECLDTTKLSNLKLVLNVAHPGTTDFIDVYPVEVIPPPVVEA